MEEKIECKVFVVEYRCPECKEGTLHPTGMVLTSYPAQYPHKCSKCSYMETFLEKYPKLSYEPAVLCTF